jgi:hypothetical protein
MKLRPLIALLSLLAASAANADAAPPTTRKPVSGELTELARTALASSATHVPKHSKLLAARAASANVEIPLAPTRVTIDLTPPARKAGNVTATGVLVFWKDADVSARVPLYLDLSVPPEALVYDVPKGAVVTLVVQRGAVEVSAPAVAAADADIGDIVQVLLRPSGRALRAQLVTKDRALAVEDGR